MSIDKFGKIVITIVFKAIRNYSLDLTSTDQFSK